MVWPSALMLEVWMVQRYTKFVRTIVYATAKPTDAVHFIVYMSVLYTSVKYGVVCDCRMYTGELIRGCRLSQMCTQYVTGVANGTSVQYYLDGNCVCVLTVH